MDGGFHDAYADGFDEGKAQADKESKALHDWLDGQGIPREDSDPMGDTYSLRGRVEIALTRASLAGTRVIDLAEQPAAQERAEPTDVRGTLQWLLDHGHLKSQSSEIMARCALSLRAEAPPVVTPPLPPLPEPYWPSSRGSQGNWQDEYTGSEMQDYARQALAAQAVVTPSLSDEPQQFPNQP